MKHSGISMITCAVLSPCQCGLPDMHNQMNVTHCIVLLEEDRALLQQFIEQNISQANELSLNSHGI